MARTALAFVSLLVCSVASGAAHAGGQRVSTPNGEASAARSPAREARLRGRQVRKARLELTRAVELEKGALSGRSNQPATDLFRAEALRSRARARLTLIDSLYQKGANRTVRQHLSDARRYESSARASEGDPGVQALFRQRLLDAQGEHDYWQRMGSYGRSHTSRPRRVSRSRPRPTVREVEWLLAATTARDSRRRARDLDAVRAASSPDQRTNMIRSRPLRFYGQAFGELFQERLSQMDASELWIDVGAGHGEALAGYARWRPDGAQLVAVDLVGDASHQAERFPGRYRSLTGDITRVRVGRKAQLVTDVFAAVSYGGAPDEVMARYGELLEPGGYAMLFLSEDRNTLLSHDGRTSEGLLGYLGRVQGFELVGEPRRFSEGTAIILRRTDAPVRAPRLELLEFAEGGPPTRVFRMREVGDLAGPLKSRFAPRRRGAY